MNTIIRRAYGNVTIRICFALLTLFFILALFAYVIAPDKTKNANRQIPQVALKGPGFTSQFLLSDKTTNNRDNMLLYRMFFGNQDSQYFIPVDSIKVLDDHFISFYNGVQTIHSGIFQSDRIIVKKFYLGTDKYGRDILSRIMVSLRTSLGVGFFAVLVSLFLGITIGAIGGYFGGQIDNLIMLLINTAWSIPTILMAFAIILVMGKGILVIVLAVGLTMWVDIARVIRGQTIQLKNELYVKASKVMGFSDIRTILYHILPGMIGVILVMASANFATAVLVEAGLSFLGLGIQPPTPSLGNMLQENYAFATGGYAYLALFPIISIMILVLTFNLIGTGLRDVFDIKTIKTYE